MGPKNIVCPLCGSNFEVEEHLEEGEITVCPDCYADLEVVSMHPFRVEPTNATSDQDDTPDENDDEF